MVSDGTNVQVWNNGHTIQVQWTPGTLVSNVRVRTAGKLTDALTGTSHARTKTVKANPLQFHFHTDSEHLIDGHYFPLELHIVHNIPQSELKSCPATGCLMVTGVMLKLGKYDNQQLKPIFDAMPLRQGVVANLPKGAQVKIGALLPKHKEYTLYDGSLTTPPCSEGVLWHVMAEPITISLNQLRKFQKAVGFTECELKKSSSKGGRSLLSEDSGSNPLVEKLSSFQRGAYSGFVHAEALSSSSHGRSLLTAGDSPDDWNCTIASVGFNNRNPQPLGSRHPKYFN